VDQEFHQDQQTNTERNR